MSDTGHLKCPCQKCGAHIEFPESGIGLTIDCPHCGEKTTLSADAPTGENASLLGTPEASTVKTKKSLPVFSVSILFVIILVTASAVMYWPKMRNHAEPLTTNTVTESKINRQPSVEPAQATDETNEFQIGPITLEKSEGGGIVYAVGTVKNDAERQRFGVKIDLDEMDKADKKIGSTSDYVAILEPRKDWRFRALLTAPNTTTAKLANIEEQK